METHANRKGTTGFGWICPKYNKNLNNTSKKAKLSFTMKVRDKYARKQQQEARSTQILT